MLLLATTTSAALKLKWLEATALCLKPEDPQIASLVSGALSPIREELQHLKSKLPLADPTAIKVNKVTHLVNSLMHHGTL